MTLARWLFGRRERREALIVRLYGLTTLIIGLAVATLGQTVLDRLTVLVFDSYQRVQPRAETAAPVVLVDIDEASIAEIGQWPWPRTALATLVNTLGQLGAAAIAFDMVFPEPDRTSLRQVAAELRRVGVTIDLPPSGDAIDNDAILASAFVGNRVVAGMAISNETDGQLSLPKAGFSYGGTDPREIIERFRGGVGNLKILGDSATGLGFFSFPPSPDGIVREIPLVASTHGHLYPALAIEALRVAQEAGSVILRSTGASGEADTGLPAITALKVGDLEVPTGPKGTFWIYFSGLASMPTVSAAGLLDPARRDALESAISGRIVIIGTSAVGLRDLVATPVAASMPGMRVHAEIIDQILGNTYLSRPDWAKGAETLAALSFGLLLILILPRVGALVCAVGTVSFIGASLALSWIAFSQLRLLIDPILPAVSVGTVFAVTMPVLLLLTNREKRFVRQAFARYLSPTVVERLADDPSALRLGGDLRDITVLFSDIRGFTSMSEKLDPQALTALLNGFLTPMTDVLLRTEATIDKYMGDAIMAFWNAPLDLPDHRRRACLAALEMTRVLRTLSVGGGEPGALKVGIGLNAGPCCVGNLGSAQRFSYSAIGDGVNVASRVEGLTKAYGVAILVTENVRAGAEDLAFLAVDLVRVVGRAEPLPVFALLGDAAHAAEPAFRNLAADHGDMIAAYRAGDFAEAQARLSALQQTAPQSLQLLYEAYAKRLDVLLVQGAPEGWAGVFTARTK
ncbi:adenylate/guanylate cyclase domain-containing protein [Aureimonas sp. SA4125]|uniref:CHASE2 domain-containing protein n=1 Tax=Aureimonas sp. SA4125 TaxID=2826993 RepID=UPI001CC5FB51|nr:adenylate/guanylate cyclase domain-containing protein [Aureimonas sp. SA4125]BDA83457.1 adenylate/guanylate cyclase domain-containing protein [Aureimonas sp. SA4125]